MIKTTTAAQLGRIAGTTVRGILWAHQQIDWRMVAAVVIDGLKILIVLALLAGRATRRAWDALPGISERIGRAYRRLIVTATAAPAPAAEPPAPAPAPQAGAQPLPAPGPAQPAPQQLVTRQADLEALTCRQLRQLTGVRKKLAKKQLIAIALAA